jgi:hypothetical protein
MPISDQQLYDNPQKLAGQYEYRIGMTRLTPNTIKEGPLATQQKAFGYLITPYVDNIQIYDSIDSAYRTADIVISDPINWRSIAPLTGHEIFVISYKNGLTSPKDVKQKIMYFSIHKVIEQDVNIATPAGFKEIVIKLVEFPAYNMLIANQIYKTYPIDEYNSPTQRFSDIVRDTLASIEDFDKWYNIDIEKSTAESINFFIPNWYPLKIINYCKKYAVSEKRSFPYYVFHIGNTIDSDKATAYFKSIYSLIVTLTGMVLK